METACCRFPLSTATVSILLQNSPRVLIADQRFFGGRTCRTFPSSRTCYLHSTNLSNPNTTRRNSTAHPTHRRHPTVRAAATGQVGGFLGRLGRVLKEKAVSDFDRVFKGVKKTRESLRVVDELLAYWTLTDSENILEELEDVSA